MRLESLRELCTHFPDIDGCWDFDNLENTEMRIQQRLPQNSNPWTPESVEALTQLARVQAFQERFLEAKGTLNQVQSKISELGEKDRVRPEIRYLLEQGRLLCLQMTPVNAQNYLHQAWVLALRSGQIYFAIDAALMLSISQPPKFQNEWLQKALELAITTHDHEAKFWLAQLYMMDAWRSFDFHRYDAALESFEKAYASPMLPQDRRTPFLIRWGTARILRALKKPDKALEIQRTLLNELQEHHQVNGHVYLEIAENLQALEQHEEARTYFELAFKNLSINDWYSDNKANELERMQYLSKNH